MVWSQVGVAGGGGGRHVELLATLGWGGGGGRCGTGSCWHLKGMFSANSFLVCSLGLLSSRCSPVVVV